MFDVDQAINAYMRRLVRRRLVSRESREEIASHLRDEVDDLIAAGFDASSAFEKASVAFGAADQLRDEYAKLYAGERWGQLKNVLSYYFDRRFVMRVAFGLALGLVFMLGGLLLEGGHVSSITQLTAALIAIGGGMGALVIGYPLAVVRKSFMLALTGQESDRTAYLNAAKVFRTFGDLCILSGAVGTVIGAIHVAENVDRGVQYLGPGIAVSMVSLLYGMLVKLFIGKPLFDSFMARAFPARDVVHGDDHDDGDRRMIA